MRTPPEILAPVGTWDMLRAAVHNGADAVYIGMPGFNARGRAATVELPELGAMITYAHLYGVRVLLAFNILIFERELPEAVRALAEVIALQPDAFIVQDIGLARLIRFMAPNQKVHASTQMTITTSEAIALTEDLGMVRYVLGREVSMVEMERIRRETTKELEVFVHGALCVSYSGQCLTSESLGGRSANRGQCAQSCRLPYDIIVDGERLAAPTDRPYVVSPQDLCGLNDIPRLMEIGIESFKIEGRLKSPEYVASTSRAYKERSLGILGDSEVAQRSRDLARVYSRGFFNGWLDGVNHQRLVNGLFSSHHGLRAGSIRSIDKRGNVFIQTSESLRAGEGVIIKDFSNDREVGGVLFSAERESGDEWRVTFARDFPLHALAPGMEVFINSSPHLEAALRHSYTDKQGFKRIPISIEISGSPGRPLYAQATDDQGNVATASSPSVLQTASKAPLSEEAVRSELGALGGTVFVLTSLRFNLEGDCFLHTKELKEIRRALCQQLQTQRTGGPQVQCKSIDEVLSWLPHRHDPYTEAAQTPHLNVLIRDSSQLDLLQGLPINTVYLDFEFGKEYAEASARVRSMGYRVGISTTRILKPGELAHLKVIERIKPDEVLVRNLGALQYLRNSGLSLVGDFSLNVANSITAQWFQEKGLSRLTPSYDLNGEQLMELIDKVDPSLVEVTIHHYIPAFHMEHCVFAAFLSNGSSYRDCGRPCEKHRVQLRDPDGTLHPLKADAECRNTMFNGYPQSASKLVPTMLKAGVTAYRIEALFESSQELRDKVTTYAALLRGTISAETAIRQVGSVEKVGVTDGQLYNIRSYQDRKKAFTALAQLGNTADPGIKLVSPSVREG